MYNRTGSKYFDAPHCPDLPQRPRAYKVSVERAKRLDKRASAPQLWCRSQ